MIPLYEFSCFRCLKCCKASNELPTYQILFPFEVLNLSKYLLIYPLVFRAKTNRIVLKWGFEIFSSCLQLDENKKTCKIHHIKPLFCRLYPLKWNSNTYTFLLDKSCPSFNTLKNFKLFFARKLFFSLENLYKEFTRFLIEKHILDLHPYDIKGSYGIYLNEKVYKIFLKNKLDIFVKNQLYLLSNINPNVKRLRFIRKYEKFLEKLKN